MELSDGKCTLCELKQKVFNTNIESFTKQIHYAFFAKNKEDYSQFTTNLVLCIICSQKLQISFDFKKSFDEMCNKNNRTNKRKCFFCEGKAPVLININNIMSDYDKKIKVFLNSVIVYHSYEGLSTCIKCIYNLNVWWETRICIYSLMNLPESIPATETAMDNYKHNNPTMKRSPRQDILSNYSLRNRLSLSTLRKESKKFKWKLYLKKRLGHVKITREIIKSENISFKDVNEIFSGKQDDKLFNQKAYVSISTNSQVSQSMLQNSNIFDTITINDSDDDNISSPVNKKSKISKTPHIKTPFKIKFSPSFSKSLILQTQPNYTCNVCDKKFLLRCDYLSHLLKHEKMESVIINVIRYKLPTQIKMTEFENQHRKKNKMSLSAKNINQLLVKWVGEHTADTFGDESDEENGKNVNNAEEETNIFSDVTEIVEKNSGYEEENVIKYNMKSNNSVIDMLVTEKDTEHSDELIKSTTDTNNHLSEQINENCQTEVADTYKPEETEENGATDCNESNGTDRDENLKSTSSIDVSGVSHTEKENNKSENQNEVEVERSAIFEIVQNIFENVDQKILQEEHVTQKDELNFTPEKTNTLENTSQTSRKSISLSLRRSESAVNNAKIVSYEELVSILEGDHDYSVEDKMTEKSTQLKGDDCNVEVKTVEEKSTQLKGNDDCNSEDKMKEKSTQLKDDDNNAEDKTKEKCMQLGNGDQDAEGKTTEKPTQCAVAESPSKNGNNMENISSDEADENIDNGSMKRKRTEEEPDDTPKRKRVRFASEKVIMTPDKSILLEKVSEGDEIIIDE